MRYICDKTFEIFRYRFHYDENMDSFIVDVYKKDNHVQRRLHINLKEIVNKYSEHFPDIENVVLDALSDLK